MDDIRERLRAAVRTWKLSPEDQADIIEEFAQHLEDQYRELAPRIGEQAARQRVLAQLQEHVLRDVRVPRRHVSAIAFSPAGLAVSLRRDALHGWRSLMRRPGIVAAGAGALAIGIGLTTLMASLIYGLLIRGLPYDGADRIGVVGQIHPMYGPIPVGIRDFLAFEGQQQSFAALGAYTFEYNVLGGKDGAERVQAYRITPEAFDLPRVRPLLGRTFRKADASLDGGAVAILSYALWRDRFGADSSIVDSTVRIDRQIHRVVGVMPEGFGYPDNAALWRPLAVDSATVADVSVIGRLREGATFESATVELGVIAKRVYAEARDTESRPVLVAQSFVRGMMPSRVFVLMYAMFAAVALVFLVSCANVANLLLDRAVHRSKEIGIRAALGASRAAIVRQFMVEAMILSSIAAVAGVIVAHVGLLAFRRAMAGEEIPSWVTFGIEPPVLIFVAATAVLAAVLSGLLPAILATRADINAVLKDQSLGSSGQRVQRASRLVVIGEIAVSCALLVGAALMTRSVLNLRTVDPGFATRSVLGASFALERADPTRQQVMLNQLLEAGARAPGVTAAALSNGPVGTGWGSARVSLPDDKTLAPQRRFVRTLSVTPSFFDTYDVRVLQGRTFVDSDRESADRVVVVNQRFAEEQFGGDNALGKRIRIGNEQSIGTSWTIVGVVPNLYSTSLSDPWPAQILMPLPVAAWGPLTLSLRTDGDPLALAEPLRKTFAAIDPDLALFSVSSVQQDIDRTLWFVTVFGTMFISFGVAALILAAIGLYAVVAFSVTRREREMGIRMALGATALDVLRVVGREGMQQIAIGTLIGLALGAGIAQLGRAALFEVAPHDPAMYLVVATLLALSGVAACLVPALRAVRVDPVVALRAE